MNRFAAAARRLALAALGTLALMGCQTSVPRILTSNWSVQPEVAAAARTAAQPATPPARTAAQPAAPQTNMTAHADSRTGVPTVTQASMTVAAGETGPTVTQATMKVAAGETGSGDGKTAKPADDKKADDKKSDDDTKEKEIKPVFELRGRINTDAILVNQSARNQAIIGDIENATGFRRARLGAQ